MLQFITRRLLLIVPVLIGIMLVTFVIARAIPSDPCVAMMGEKATQAQCAEFRERYGLNDNIFIQFFRYLGQVVQGNFGDSIQYHRPVMDYVSERLPMTFELTIGAMLFSTITGIFLGIISALNRNTIIDTATMVLANIGVSMPVFWLGLMLAYVFSLVFKGTPLYIPPSGRLTPGLSLAPLATVWHMENLTGLARFVVNFLSNSVILNSLLTGNFTILKDALWHLILPSFAVGTIPMATIARMTRSSLLEVLGLDYIRTARAKGLVASLVIRKHALRNALIPIVTVIGLETGALLSGAVLTETVFTLPGMGTALVSAILSRDYPVVQGFTVVIAFIFVLTNLIVDLSYAYFDPRIRLE
ncbi:MAG TPA: ABC transporter permease [Anaerolineaceae bacterium]|nr:ABC transporter permease [Anaerolineaceae bacterium]